jgi:hypothetical protein
MRVLTIDEVNLTFGIETDGYGHTWLNYLLQEMPPSGGIFFVRVSGFWVFIISGFGVSGCYITRKHII